MMFGRPGGMHPPVGVFSCSLAMAYRPQITSATSLHGRRCRSTSCISDLADSVTSSQIDHMFCTAQQQQQQPADDEDSQRSSSDINSSDNCRRHHVDDEMTSRRGVDDATETIRRRPTLDEMFCTQCSTLNKSSTLSITDPAQRSASSDESAKKQVRSQLVKSATIDVRRLCHQMKKNKIRSPSDTGRAVCPRQPVISAVNHS